MSYEDEIDVLWHGRWVVQDLIAQFGDRLSPHQTETLAKLVIELDRIRRMRIQRQGQHIRAKQKRRAQAVRKVVN